MDQPYAAHDAPGASRVSEAAPVALRVMSAEEFTDYRPPMGMRAELVAGEVLLMTGTGGQHGQIAMAIGMLLAQHVRTHRLGVVFAAETGFVLFRVPDTVRCPDASFVSAARLPGDVPRTRIEGAPDLAVEVLSPDDRAIEVEEKVAQHLAAGARLVWVINPKLRSATVYAPDASPQVLHEHDPLDGGDVVPGFSCPLRDALDW
jgi:Uma2 family endonuclease